MTPLNKKLLWSTLVLMPISWFTLTVVAGVITWWHGYALYFVYLMLLITLIATPCVLCYKKSVHFFGLLLFISCFLFNVYGLIILFFPELKGWGNWERCNLHGCWPDIYFQLPADFNYATLLIFFGLILVYGGKKFFEIDLEAMKNKVRKRKEVMQNHVYFIDTTYKKEGPSFEITFKSKYLVKSEHWLHAAIVFICCYFILPLGGAAGGIGSSMTRDGNNPIIATVFFVFGYFFLCFCVYTLIGAYAQYKLIWAMEKELGVKLEPALGHKNASSK